MNNVDYMINNNGNIIMFCEQLPDKGFIDAIKVRNVCMVCLRTIKQKKQTGGGPDVDVMSITGEQEVITRKQLMDNYVHCNGKRINVKFLRNGHKYYVYNVCRQPEPYKILKIPENCKGSIGTKEAKAGSYIVCRANEDGTINRQTMYIVSEKMFKKCFRIPIQTIIKKHLYKNTNKSFGLYNPQKLAEVRGYHKQNSIKNVERAYNQNISTPHQISLGTGIDIGIQQPIKMTTIQKPVNMANKQIANTQVTKNQPVKTQVNTVTQENKTQYKYTVTHRILGASNCALLGYVVKEISSGKSKQLRPQQVMTLCENHLIDNVMLVKRDNGIKFLKGNNMRLESLPHIIG